MKWKMTLLKKSFIPDVTAAEAGQAVKHLIDVVRKKAFTQAEIEKLDQWNAY